jgi:autotransporter-associated beta strand protein
MKSQASLSALFITLLSVPFAHVASAGSATWNLNPSSGDWDTAINWTPNTVPNGSSDIATFEVSNTTDVSLSSSVTLSSIVFNPGASAFTLDIGLGPTLTIQGAGFINNSGTTQQIVLPVDTAGNLGSMQIFDGATAGMDTVFTVSGSFTGYLGGYINFWDTSTAGDATFMIGGGVSGSSAVGGRVTFSGTSTAGNGTFLCEGGGAGTGTAAVTNFYDSSSAGNATIVANGSSFSDGAGAQAFFSFSSTADNATLTATGTQSGFAAGTIYFASDATGGTARIRLSGTGNLNLTFLDLASLTIGSIEGNGQVFLGSKDLFVGSNNANTTFGGVISGTGSLNKIGGGKLILTNGSTYSGGTRIKRGALLVKNAAGSATGGGRVEVDGGTFGGTGTIAGAVTVGTGSGHKAVIRPGQAQTTIHTALSIGKGLTLNSDAKGQFVLNSNNGIAGAVIAKGVTIDNALFSISDLGNSTLPPGATFTLISNTAASSIAGTFSNLADGSTFTVGNNSFQVSYEGGDGNDLTLTVVQ